MIGDHQRRRGRLLHTPTCSFVAYAREWGPVHSCIAVGVLDVALRARPESLVLSTSRVVQARDIRRVPTHMDLEHLDVDLVHRVSW